MKSQRIRLMVVDDHPAFRLGVVAMLSDQPDIEVVCECADGLAAIESYRQLLPEIVLMDLRMPRMSGVDAILEIRREFADCRIIVLTTYDADEDIFRAIQSGAKSYLLKDSSQDEIVETVRAVHEGRAVLPPLAAAALSQRLNRKELTERELQILKYIVKGRSNKEISSDLSISERTVKFHIASLFLKLNVQDRTQAAIAAVRHGIIHIE